MADRVAPEAIGTLHSYGVGTRADPTLLISGHDERPVWDSGRADAMCDLRGRSFYIEIKNGIAGFDLTSWRDNQREWARDHGRLNSEYWLWLSLGIDSPTYAYGAIRPVPVKKPASVFGEDFWGEDKDYTDAKKKFDRLGPIYLPRRAWLVPYPVMLEVDALVRPIQNTLVYRAGKGMKKEIQARRLDAPTLLKGFELTWAGHSKWSVPEAHPFSVMYLNAPPIPFLYEHLYGERACPTRDPLRQTVSSVKPSAMLPVSEKPLVEVLELSLAAIPSP